MTHTIVYDNNTTTIMTIRHHKSCRSSNDAIQYAGALARASSHSPSANVRRLTGNAEGDRTRWGSGAGSSSSDSVSPSLAGSTGSEAGRPFLYFHGSTPTVCNLSTQCFAHSTSTSSTKSEPRVGACDIAAMITPKLVDTVISFAPMSLQSAVAACLVISGGSNGTHFATILLCLSKSKRVIRVLWIRSITGTCHQ